MNPLDRAILEHCADDFHPLRPLRDRFPQGSLYRHVDRSVSLGWLQKEGTRYMTTDSGRRQLIDTQSTRQWDGLARVYPPLRLVPTAVHRGMAELILAAVAIRQHGTRLDRHPFFVCAGGTLRWKTSLGLFICWALGLDPAVYLIDCGAESGKSLAIRRSGTGAPVFQRELLTAAFITLDEFLTADPSVQPTLRLFLSGRLTMPFENDSVTIQPVPLLTLNPREKPTLEGRLGLSAPQIRRAIVANLDAVPMPDLAAIGEEALTAAQAHAPLVMAPPADDCRVYHQQILALTRAIVLPEAQERVDVHLVENLCSGMTSFIPDPNDAIAHVGHALATVFETLGWTRPGWIDAVQRFTTDQKTPAPSRAAEPARPASLVALAPQRTTDHAESLSSVLSLRVPPTVRESGLPSLALSDALKRKLVWLAEETGRPVEETLAVLIVFYHQCEEGPDTLMQLKKILSLAQELELAEVEVATLQGYLEMQATLAQYQCTVEDVPQALNLIEALSALPADWDWPTARAALRNVAAFLRAEIPHDQIQTVLTQHGQLAELGFDASTAVAVAQALTRAGAVGPRRAATLRQMATVVVKQVEVRTLDRTRARLAAEVSRLAADHDQRRQSVTEITKRLEDLQRQKTEAQQRLTQLEGDWTAHTEDLEALRALRAFLLRKTAAIDAFFADMERVRQYRRQGRAPDHYAVLNLDEIRQQLLGFFQRLATEAQQP